MLRLADLVTRRAGDLGYDSEKTEKGRKQFDAGLLAVVVVASPKPSEKIPLIEQTLSAGAVCLSLLNAALAAGEIQSIEITDAQARQLVAFLKTLDGGYRILDE